jgi:hypothetical protein
VQIVKKLWKYNGVSRSVYEFIFAALHILICCPIYKMFWCKFDLLYKRKTKNILLLPSITSTCRFVSCSDFWFRVMQRPAPNLSARPNSHTDGLMSYTIGLSKINLDELKIHVLDTAHPYCPRASMKQNGLYFSIIQDDQKVFVQLILFCNHQVH